MKGIGLFIFYLFLICSAYAQQISVLFVGNSYTYTNDLPQLLSQMGVSDGNRIETKSYTSGGARFMSHCQNADLLEDIKRGEYDILILQGQSQEVAFPYEQFMQEVYLYAKQLDDLYKENNPGGRVIYFMTWGYRYGDQMNCPFYSPFCTYRTMSQELCKNYSMMANDFQSEVSPIGRAWLYLFEQDSLSFDLHSDDYSHPNMKGSYFSACILYTMIYQKEIHTDFFADLDPQTAQQLQQTANDLFSKHKFVNCSFESSLTETNKSDLMINYIASKQVLKVDNSENNFSITAEIFDLQGIKVSDFKIEKNKITECSLNLLPEGCYVVKGEAKGKKVCYKFVKI
ncbi:MAG: T9SS type A sorting domain-containing protein [Bacteroidales bacterium]|nr:T9SS type A sorting domain-containing protein [Bacteroidales bacterium]